MKLVEWIFLWVVIEGRMGRGLKNLGFSLDVFDLTTTLLNEMNVNVYEFVSALFYNSTPKIYESRFSNTAHAETSIVTPKPDDHSNASIRGVDT